MRIRGLLTVFLLAVALCLVPALGYGEVRHGMWESNATDMEVSLLEARVTYMMYNPTNFLNVRFACDPTGLLRSVMKLPERIDTKDKIYVAVMDNRGLFSHKSEIALVDEFKRQLEAIYSFVQTVATDMDVDIVAEFFSKQGIAIGYFYQGEYHLWED